MKNVLATFLLIAIIPAITPALHAQESDSQYIEWMGDNDEANSFVSHGIWFMMNHENEKAIAMFQSALHEDPTLFGPHMALSNLTKGASAESHKAKAKELVKGKNEVSRMFVSLADVADGDEATVRNTWAKMAELSPDGVFIQYVYALTRETPEETMTALEKMLSMPDAAESNLAFVHNILGYLEMRNGDMDAAKQHFESYVSLYENGYNPHDSMGDYYKAAGDNEKAMASYAMAIENYPGASTSKAKLADLEEEMENEDRGVLVMVSTEHVIPEHMAEYWQWGEEYKAKAEEDGYTTFYVDAANSNSFSYASIAGYTMSDVQESNEAWAEWAQTEDMKAMYEKYKHTVEYTERALWRHSPALSYVTQQDAESSEMPEYVRVFKGYLKFGHEEEVKALLAEMKALCEEHDVESSYQVYWNVFGEDGPCLGVRMMYADEEDYAANKYEMREKISEEKMMELNQKIVEHMRHFEETESFPLEALTHLQNTEG